MLFTLDLVVVVQVDANHKVEHQFTDDKKKSNQSVEIGQELNGWLVFGSTAVVEDGTQSLGSAAGVPLLRILGGQVGGDKRVIILDCVIIQCLTSLIYSVVIEPQCVIFAHSSAIKMWIAKRLPFV